jgi:hypothetical protein
MKKVQREPWGSSSEKAKSLKIENFGTQDEVRKNARPIRTANNRQAAVEILKGIIKNGPFTSRSGLIARLSGKAIGKMVSNQAVNTSFNPHAHFLAVANLDYLFKNAIEPWKFELNPTKNNDGLKDRRYLYAPFEYEESIIVVKFTIKEYVNEQLKSKLYSIEAIDTKI